MSSAHHVGRSRMLMLLAVVCVTMFFSQQAHADPISFSQWYEFQFGGAGSFATACFGCQPSSGGNSIFAPNPPWVFSGAGVLTVTDAFNLGDSFNVFDNNVLIFMTPSVLAAGECGSDPVPCAVDPLVSHGSFILGPGAHSITIQLRDSPYNTGAAYFRVDPSPVPEPATVLLLGTGLVGAIRATRRKRKVSQQQ